MKKLITLTLMMIASNSLAADWQGVFSGPEVPGYKILSSQMIWRDGFSAPTSNFSFSDQIGGMVKYCRDDMKGFAN